MANSDNLTGYTHPETSSANDPRPFVVTSSPMSKNRDYNTTTSSVQRGGTPVGGASPHTAVNDSSTNSVHGQAQDETRSRWHVEERQPLLRDNIQRVQQRRYDRLNWKRLIIKCLFSIFFFFALSIAISLFIGLLTHYLSNHPVTTPLTGIDGVQVTLILKTLSGGLVKSLSLSVPTNKDLNEIDVYMLPSHVIAANWTNSTVYTQLDNHPGDVFYAMEGSIITVNNITTSRSFKLQLIHNEASYCGKNFTGLEKEKYYKCVVDKSDFYQLQYTSDSEDSIDASVSYNIKEIILDDIPPDCRISQLNNCTLFLSFTRKYNLVLSYKQYYSSFPIRTETSPRYELYCFVLLFPIVLLILFVSVYLFCHRCFSIFNNHNQITSQ